MCTLKLYLHLVVSSSKRSAPTCNSDQQDAAVGVQQLETDAGHIRTGLEDPGFSNVVDAAAGVGAQVTADGRLPGGVAAVL